MTPVKAADQVFEAVGRVKASAPAFCTNFFPVQAKLERWVRNGHLYFENLDRAVFFLRKDRDFWRLYFCAAQEEALPSDLERLATIRSEPVILDVLGNTGALAGWEDRLKSAGLRPYNRLQRMARISQPQSPPPSRAIDPAITLASHGEASSILAFLESLFDPFADQLPEVDEIEAAISNKQVLAVQSEGALAAILFFETQGFSSTIRFWAVGKLFQSRHLGAALMRHYWLLHQSVRRFNLWVGVDNQNAVQKYQHYGYSADGLQDLVLVNEKICA